MDLPSLQAVYIATNLLRKCSSQVPWLLSKCLLEINSNIHSGKTGSEPQLCHPRFCLYLFKHVINVIKCLCSQLSNIPLEREFPGASILASMSFIIHCALPLSSVTASSSQCLFYNVKGMNKYRVWTQRIGALQKVRMKAIVQMVFSKFLFKLFLSLQPI